MIAMSKSQFHITGWHVLIGMCAFFGVIIAADVYFASLAFRSFSGEVASNPYEAGIAFNETLEQRRAQAALGWSAQVDSETPGEIIVTLKDRGGAGLTNLGLTGNLMRPATDEGRIDLTFTHIGEGAYRAETGVLDGAWDLSAVAAGAGDDRFELEYRFVSP